MSEPISNSAAEYGPPERLHPLFLVTGLGSSVRQLIGGYAAILYLVAKGMVTTAMLVGLAIVLISTVALYLYWRRFEYRIGPDGIRIDSGIVNRTHRSIPFDRVQDVDISQGPVARMLGLAAVRFETGAAAAATTEEGVLKAIALGRAEQLRELVRARGAIAGPSPDPQEAARPPLFRMNGRRLLLAGLFNFSLALFAGLFGLSQTAGDLVGFDPLSRAFWLSLLSSSAPVTALILANQAVAVLAGLLFLLLAGAATGIVRTVIRDFRFRLDRTDTGLRRRRGLLTLTDVTLPVRRAQAAIVASGPVRDRFGWAELKLQSLARDEGAGDHSLAPLADRDEIGDIVEQLGWRRPPDKPVWARVSRAYVWTLALALIPLMIAALVHLAIVPPFGLAALAALAAAVGIRWLAWTRTGYMLDGDRLLVRTGWWRRRILILPRRRIQSADLSHSFISRWFKIASLQFGVAGGSGISIHAIPALDEQKARSLRAELLSLPS